MKLTFDEIETAIASIFGGAYIPNTLDVNNDSVTFNVFDDSDSEYHGEHCVEMYPGQDPIIIGFEEAKENALIELNKQIW